MYADILPATPSPAVAFSAEEVGPHMGEERYRVRWGDGQHASVPLTKAEAEETAAFARRYGIKAEVVQELLPSDAIDLAIFVCTPSPPSVR